MKQKLLEKLDTLFQMSIFYLVMLCLTFIIAMIMGKTIGRTYLPYELMTSCILHMGIFTLCMTLFLTDLLFVQLKYWMRILLCLITTFGLIEIYTLYKGFISTGRPTVYLFHNQILFLEFFFLLLGWTIYSKVSSYRYHKLLTAYQNHQKL